MLTINTVTLSVQIFVLQKHLDHLFMIAFKFIFK